MANVGDYLLWYCKDIDRLKYRKLYIKQQADAGSFTYSTLPDGSIGTATDGSNAFASLDLSSSGTTQSCIFPHELEGRSFKPTSGKSWKTNPDGMVRLAAAERLFGPGRALRYKLFHSDYPVVEQTNLWTDTLGATGKLYVVQTNTSAVQRCLLMTTDPGDLVLDPTCGSGTTAYVAEQWGRRWITVDTSRVAVALARQRVLTAKFPMYRLRPATDAERAARPTGTWLRGPDGEKDPHTFEYETVPHVTLGSIARNTHLDPIFEKHRPKLDAALEVVNAALADVTDDLRAKLAEKFAEKMQAEGLRSATDADRRRWLLPGTTKGQIAEAFAGKTKLKARHVQREADGVPPDGRFEHWHVPFDTDPIWPESLTDAVTAYRTGWRAKMDEVDACIAEHAECETLVDRPEVVKHAVRVSGPFTVEAVQPAEFDLTAEGEAGTAEFAGAPEELADTFTEGVANPLKGGLSTREIVPRRALDAQNAAAYLETMLTRLRADGVTFPGNRAMQFTRLDRLGGDVTGLHAEGRWHPVGGGKEADGADDGPEGPPTVGVMIGPQYGSVTAKMVEQVIRPAQRAYDDLVIAAFSFDGPAQAVIDEAANPRLTIHAAHIRPDANPAMDGLLKEGAAGQQLFTVFGKPRTEIDGPVNGTYTAIMDGVDIYDPKTGEVVSTGAGKVAAWFLDGDYDGRTFCVSQAFFPDRDAWGKLAKALGDGVDQEAFAAFSGVVSLPFEAGGHRRCAIKVIDPRGNEVMRVHELPDGSDAPAGG